MEVPAITVSIVWNILSLERNNSANQQLDNINYNYNITQNNRLNSISQGSANTAAVKSSQYTYDDIGNLASDAGENISQIGWNVYGKVTNVTQTDSDPDIEFIYDAMGNRIGKKVIKKNGEIKFTFYVRDAQGNILATYTAIPKNVAVLNDFHIYGSSRLGTKELNMAMLKPAHPLPVNPNQDIFARYLGYKKFEVNNHLGNVLTIFTDRKMPQGTLNSTITSYQPVLIASQDYYPFGMQMDSRGDNSLNTPYRFGFNGQEKDREIYNNENTTTALFWEYDGRIGRRWNVDPVVKEWESSYLTFSANPVFNVDIKGDNAGWYVDNKTGDVIGKDKKDDDNVFVVEKESDKQKIKDDNFQNGVDQSELKGESVRVPTFTGRSLQKNTEESGRKDNAREYANTLSVGVGSLRSTDYKAEDEFEFDDGGVKGAVKFIPKEVLKTQNAQTLYKETGCMFVSHTHNYRVAQIKGGGGAQREKLPSFTDKNSILTTESNTGYQINGAVFDWESENVYLFDTSQKTSIMMKIDVYFQQFKRTDNGATY